jgi:hypothetical protein
LTPLPKEVVAVVVVEEAVERIDTVGSEEGTESWTADF